MKKSQNIMNMIVGSDNPDIDRPDIKGRGHYLFENYYKTKNVIDS